MGLNGVSLSSLVMAKRLMVYVSKHSPKVEKTTQRQPSAHHNPKEDQAFIQGKDKSLSTLEQTPVKPVPPSQNIGFEGNTYTKKSNQTGVEQVIPAGKNVKREV